MCWLPFLGQWQMRLWLAQPRDEAQPGLQVLKRMLLLPA